MKNLDKINIGYYNKELVVGVHNKFWTRILYFTVSLQQTKSINYLLFWSCVLAYKHNIYNVSVLENFNIKSKVADTNAKFLFELKR